MILFEKKYLGVSSGDETLHLMFDILHHKYFLSERLRLNAFYEYCKDLKPKLFCFPVHFGEQTLDHFSDKLTPKGFLTSLASRQRFVQISKNDANHS